MDKIAKRIAWNKGLTAETNSSLKRQADKKSEWWKTHDTTETRKKIGISSKGREGAKLEKSSNWKGGKYKSSRDSYVMVYVGGYKYIPEHRHVMQEYLGRELTIDEEVHHINGIKDDNRLENLKLVIKKMHYGCVKCPYCSKSFEVK